jgi:hypothetical protein
MERSQMLKLMYKLNRIFTVLNKYIFILPLISIISKFFTTDIKFLNTIKTLIKALIIIHIVLGGFVILYFTDFVTPLNTTYSIYSDLLEPYIELLKVFWNKLISYFTNLPDPSSVSKSELESVVKDSTSQMKIEVKSGIKEGVKEIVDELLAEIDNKPNYFYYLLKQICLYSSLIFFGYFLFVLPSNPESLTEYNFINQSLIEFKLTVKDFIIDLFTKPTNPGNPGSSVTPVAPGSIESPISPNTPSSQLNKYFPIESNIILSKSILAS